MAADLTIHTERDPGGAVVTTLLGELDVASTTQLLDHIGSLPATPSALDCRFLSFIGAPGLGSLIELGATHGVTVRPSRAVLRVLDACTLTEHFCIDLTDDPPALGGAPFAVALYDADVRFVYVNEMMAEINGVPARSHLGAKPNEIFSITEGGLTPEIERAVAQGTRTDLLVDADASGVDVLARCTVTRTHHAGGVGALVVVQNLDPDLAASLRSRRLRFSKAA